MTRQSSGVLLQAEENDRLALQWAGPVGWAILQVLRQGEGYSEADFQALVARGERELREARGSGLAVAALAAVAAPLEPVPEVPAAVPTGATEPAPPAEHYRVVRNGQAQSSRTRRISEPTAPRPAPRAAPPVYRPAGERDASGRIVKRI